MNDDEREYFRTFLFLIVFMLSFTGLVQLANAESEGFMIKSVSSYPTISNNADIRTANLTVTISVDGSGEQLYGEWQSLDRLKLRQPFRLEMGSITERLSYPVLNQGSLFRYKAFFKDAPDFLNGAKCDPKPFFCFPVDTDRVGSGLDRVLIIEREPVLRYGLFGNPDLSWAGMIRMTLNGTEYRQWIGSGDLQRSRMQIRNKENEWIANVAWSGSLITGEAVPDQYGCVAIYDDAWNVATRNDFEQYRKSLIETDTLLQAMQSEYPDGFDEEGHILKPGFTDPALCKDQYCSSILNLATAHNFYVEKLRTSRLRIGYTSPTAVQEQASENGNVIILTDRKITVPELIVTMRAESIGAYISSGKPEIVSIDAAESNLGDSSGKIIVRVRNAGNEKGTFFVRVDGARERQISLNASEEGNVSIQLESFIAGKFNGTVEVYDSVSGETARKDFQRIVLEPKRFIPNSSDMYNEIVMRSDGSGMNQSLEIDCTSGLFVYSGQGYDCFALNEIRELKEPKREIVLSSAQPAQKAELVRSDLTGYEKYILIGLIGLLFVAILEKLMRLMRKKGAWASVTFVLLALSVAIFAIALIVENKESILKIILENIK